MALTLPYPTLASAFSPTGATVDVFTPSTIHSDIAHNNPHAKLLANDVAIRDAFNIFESAVNGQFSSFSSTFANIRFKWTTNTGPLSPPVSWTDFMTFDFAKQFNGGLMLIMGRCTATLVSEAFTESGIQATLFYGASQLGASTVSCAQYSASMMQFEYCLVPFSLLTGDLAMTRTIALKVKYKPGSYNPPGSFVTTGILMAFEIGNAVMI